MGTKAKPKATNFAISAGMMMRAREVFAPFRYELPDEWRDTPRYCYVKTVLGYLEIDIRKLLYLMAYVVSPDEVTEITEDVLEMALRVVERLPDYLMNDLLGSRHEELLRKRVDLELRPRRDDDQLQVDTEAGIHLVRLLLSKIGPGILEIDLLRHTFTGLFSSRGYVGRKAWTSFVESSVQVKRRKGRPRKSEYDLIYQQRTGGAPESYGKLLRQISSSDTITRDVFLNRAKAAVSYRKRKNLRTMSPR